MNSSVFCDRIETRSCRLIPLFHYALKDSGYLFLDRGGRRACPHAPGYRERKPVLNGGLIVGHCRIARPAPGHGALDELLNGWTGVR